MREKAKQFVDLLMQKNELAGVKYNIFSYIKIWKDWTYSEQLYMKGKYAGLEDVKV